MVYASGRWYEDERSRQHICKYDETNHSHGSYFRVDDLRFYFCYHAMMEVAGELLAAKPPGHDPDHSTDDFTYWLRRHTLSREDGNWLAERRDALPKGLGDWRHRAESHDWPWSIERDTFDTILKPSIGIMTLWGDWNIISGGQEEDISVRSALVSRDGSEALLKAVQISDPSCYRIPGAGEESEIDIGGFSLKGWVVAEAEDNRLDKFDPWAADITFSSLKPAAFVCELMDLRPDPEQRIGKPGGTDKSQTALWAEVWGEYRERDSEDDLQKGTRLRAAEPFPFDLLRKMDKDLIVCVQVRREFRDSQYRKTRDQGLEYIRPSARLFLVIPEGSVATL